MDPDEARRVLAVDATASEEEVKRAYRSAMKRWHPDRAAFDSSLDGTMHEQTQRINAAYRLLLDAGDPQLGPTEAPTAWRGRQIRTVRVDWWPATVLLSGRTPVVLGVVAFVLVWGVLVGLALGFESLVLQ